MLEEKYGQYWKTVIDTMLEGLMLVDPEGNIIYTNQAFANITGYTRDELAGKTCEVLGCDTCFGTRKDGHGKYCALFNEGDVRRRKCTLAKKDGSPAYVLKNAAVIRDENGRVIGGVENLTDLTPVVAKEQLISRLRRQLNDKDSFHGMLGKSPAMQQTFDLIASAAQSDAPVIIYGESGTGKELVAAAIHKIGPRSRGPYIKVNCAALNENLLESELFGHVRGAFTGADRSRQGRFEAANNGDIFLDEIGDLPLATQTKLLRVLQEKEIERVGDHHSITINTRILAATNQDLGRLMQKGSFREDLYYRIGVIPIYLPALRDRLEDVPVLTEAFINRIRLKTDKPISGINKETLDLLIRYSWPGNVRELLNIIEYAFVLCPAGEITPAHLPAQITGQGNPALVLGPGPSREMPDAKRDLLLEALKAAGGNKSEAARMLGISRVTLWKRIKKYGIQVDKKISA